MPAPTKPHTLGLPLASLKSFDAEFDGEEAAEGGDEISAHREDKIDNLVSGGSLRLAREASKEACLLAPYSMFLGGRHRMRLAVAFDEIARQLTVGEPDQGFVDSSNLNGSVEGGTGGRVKPGGGRRGPGIEVVNGGRTKEFEAYRALLVAARQGERGGCKFSHTEVERLVRMRNVVEPAAAKVAGEALAHEALSTIWREAGLVAHG